MQRAGRSVFAVVTVVLLLGIGSSAARDCAENAAFYYWKAAAMVPKPATAEEFDMLMFAERATADLPPQAFNAWPEAGRWLLQHDAIQAELRRARECTLCDFAVRRPGTPLLELDHLPALRGVVRYSTALARAYEYAQNPRAAAGLYADLLTMVLNLDQDRNLGSALVAVDLLQQLLSQIAQFLDRTDDRAAVEELWQVVRGLRQPVFHLGDYLRDESQRFSRWLLEDPDAAVAKLNSLYGQQEHRPAADRLLAVEGLERKKRLQNWVMDYEARMIRLADAVDKPYLQGIKTVRAMDAERERLVKSASSLPAAANPLVPLLVPSLERVYQRILLAEGQLEALRLLCAAARYRVDRERWPLNIGEIQSLLGGGTPADPFSGEPLYYRLVGVRPRIVIRVPRWMARQRDLVYTIDLGAWSQESQKRLARFFKENLAPAPPAAGLRSPVPAGR